MSPVERFVCHRLSRYSFIHIAPAINGVIMKVLFIHQPMHQ